VASGKVAKAEELSRRQVGTGDDAAESGAEDGGEGLRHAVAGLAHGDDQGAGEAAEVIHLAAGTEVAALALEPFAEGARDAALAESVLEHLASALTHFAKDGFGRGIQRRVGRLRHER
jgi:hypothetical protein